MNVLEYEKLYPLKFRPIYMERVWGGNMISEVFNRELPPHDAPIGESWELVDRPEVKSVVSEGELAGETLHDLLAVYGRKLVGGKGGNCKEFPSDGQIDRRRGAFEFAGASG